MIELGSCVNRSDSVVVKVTECCPEELGFVLVSATGFLYDADQII